MNEVEIWITVGFQNGDRTETMCTLLARRTFHLCPRKGEKLSFLQSKGSAIEFNLLSEIGPLRRNLVMVTVDEVDHYSMKDNETHAFRTALRCSEVPAVSRADAKAVVDFMTSQAGFEVDPYGVNNLG
jgi:hypothetical protein